MVYNVADVMIRNNQDCNKMICVWSVQNRAIYTEKNKRKENRKRAELKAKFKIWVEKKLENQKPQTNRSLLVCLRCYSGVQFKILVSIRIATSHTFDGNGFRNPGNNFLSQFIVYEPAIRKDNTGFTMIIAAG